MRPCGFPSLLTVLALVAVGLGGPPPATAEIISFSGTISYQGTHSGDTLFVAILDTAGVEDVSLLALGAIPVGPPPFDQPYSLDFDNADGGPFLFVASFLDVDGGGVGDVGGADVFGWYDGNAEPVLISSAASQAGLDFSLPRAEIHGTLTMPPGSTEARPDATTDPTCTLEGFRPRPQVFDSGPYSIVGLYPGTYCISAERNTMSGPQRVCFGDPTCANPTLVTLSETEVRNGVDLDFTAIVPVSPTTWGRVKSRYP
jgi:hypothetical protein